MKGIPNDEKLEVLSWIRRHGSHFTLSEAARVWSVPVKTMKTWYWEADCAARSRTGRPHDFGVATAVARIPFTQAPEACRRLAEERDASFRAIQTA